jgi:hypothetical protein
MRNSQGAGLSCSAPLGQRNNSAIPKRPGLDVALFPSPRPRGTTGQPRRRSGDAGRPTPEARSAQSSPTRRASERTACPGHQKWRSTANLAHQTPRAAARLSECKILQARALQPIETGLEQGEMALLTLGKAPFCAIFRHFFVDFPCVFSASLVAMALWARMRPRTVLVWNWPRSN